MTTDDFSEPEPSPEDIAAATPAEPARVNRGAFRGDPNGNGYHAPAEPHRMLPASVDAEQGILCSFLLAPKEVGALCGEKKVMSENFHVPGHGQIYAVLMAMWDSGKQIDIVTLIQTMHDAKVLDACGGAGFVSQLFTFLPTAANAEYYIAIIKEKWVLREQIRVCTGIIKSCYDRQDDVPGQLDAAEKDLLSIRARLTENRITTSRIAVIEAFDELQKQLEATGKMVGMPSGFTELDEMTGGFRNAEVAVIAARPSNGKTAIAVNIVEHLAIEKGYPVGIFSVEMSTKSLMHRLIASRGRVNLVRWRTGDHGHNDFDRVSKAVTEIGQALILVDDTSAISIQELRGKARIMKSRHGIRALFVDYLQLVTSHSRRAQENSQQEVSEVSAGLKALAKELDLPVIALAQLNRGFEERALEGRPRLADLRGSGSIEQDADLIAFLVREELYAKTTDDAQALAGLATLTVGKQRNGPLGQANLTFLKEFSRFENRHYGDEPPDQGQLPI